MSLTSLMRAAFSSDASRSALAAAQSATAASACRRGSGSVEWKMNADAEVCVGSASALLSAVTAVLIVMQSTAERSSDARAWAEADASCPSSALARHDALLSAASVSAWRRTRYGQGMNLSSDAFLFKSIAESDIARHGLCKRMGRRSGRESSARSARACICAWLASAASLLRRSLRRAATASPARASASWNEQGTIVRKPQQLGGRKEGRKEGGAGGCHTPCAPPSRSAALL